MNRLKILALTLLVAASTKAQTIYEGADFASKDLNGTARFVAMGGAMGALGGDISTISTNPAGIGIYRSNDAMLSFGYSSTGRESTFDGFTLNADKNRWSFDNIGFVLSNKIGNTTTVRFVNFGFNYHKAKNFYRSMAMEGMVNTGPTGELVSQTYLMASQAQGIWNTSGVDMSGQNNIFDHAQIGWLAALGWEGYLYDSAVDENGEIIYGCYDLPAPYSTFRSYERGGIDQYDFNVSLNLNDRVYLGLTIGAYDVNYSKYSFYSEDFTDTDSYSLESWSDIEGAGFDFKFGAIVRPFEYSPLRIGLAIHTPTFYKLTMYNSARLVSNYISIDENNNEIPTTALIDTRDYLDGGDMEYDFELRTPWKYNVSLGYTVSNYLALGAEYEYQDYTGIRYYYPEGDEMYDVNQMAKNMLKGVHALRIGAEYKVIQQFAIRAGYNYTSAAYKDYAFKDLPLNAVSTDSDYANSQGQHIFTLGVGYRGKSFYADLAYQYQTYKADFYAFADEFLNKTEVTNTRSHALLTLGFRF